MEWFENWFDSPYYHILYKNRDYSEAEFFLDNLVNHLKPKANANMLDLACGKGRHSYYLAKKGFKVTGLDLSPESIEHANKQSEGNPNFAIHDLRENYLPQHFNYVFNFFTSFGYFADKADNEKAVKAMAHTLKANGTLVIDFFNATKVQQSIVPTETKVIDRITFNITRKIDDGKVIKKIRFEDNNKLFDFEEKVQLVSLDEFTTYLTKAGFSIKNLFGDYALNAFDQNNSPRLIIEAQKNVG